MTDCGSKWNLQLSVSYRTLELRHQTEPLLILGTCTYISVPLGTVPFKLGSIWSQNRFRLCKEPSLVHWFHKELVVKCRKNAPWQPLGRLSPSVRQLNDTFLAMERAFSDIIKTLLFIGSNSPCNNNWLIVFRLPEFQPSQRLWIDFERQDTDEKFQKTAHKLLLSRRSKIVNSNFLHKRNGHL